MEDVIKKIRQLLEQTEWSEKDRQWLQHYLHTTNASDLETLMRQQFDHSIDSSDQPGSSNPATGSVRPAAETLDPVLAQKILENIHEKMGGKILPLHNTLPSIPLIRIAAAGVAVLLILGTWLWMRENGHRSSQQISAQPVIAKTAAALQHDADPGTKKAILTLSDGSAILLDDAHDGVLAHQGNTSLLKSNDKLIYQPAGTPAGKTVYNTITTPRGGEFHVELPDGSQVWLNAASSIRFPTSFTGGERRVEITGEAYFEIAANPSKPFMVNIQNSEIRVLGTHFNVSGYTDETTIRTTLLEGSVQFVHGDAGSLLKPGQQARLSGNGKIKVASDVDLPAIMAWKNGFFDFKGADIGTVMNQLSRWYDVEVVYAGDKTAALFYAEIPRDTKLSNVLKALELTSKLKLKFSIEDKKITITN